MSVILTFLLLFTTIAGMGITTASAKEYANKINVNVGDLSEGDIINEGTRLYRNFYDSNIKSFKIYYNDEFYTESSYSIIISNRRATLVSKKTDPDKSTTLLLYFSDFSSLSDQNPDNALKEELQKNETINLSEDVSLMNTLVINDGKNHVINTNGYNFSIDESGKSIISVEYGSTLTINGLGENEEKTTFFGEGQTTVYESGAIRVSAKSSK